MTNLEKQLYQYINTFYTLEEKSGLIQDSSNINYFWNDIVSLYKKILPYSNLNNYTLRVAPNCSFFIKKLFTKYVNNKTFVISTTNEFITTKECLDSVQHKYLLRYDEIKKLSIDKIINEIKKSCCDNVFIYMVGTLPATGQIVPQQFFIKLKKALLDLKLPNFMVLDDVHGMFIVPRDYSLFDYILYTGHSYIPDFDIGFAWTKEKDFGSEDINKTLNYYNRLCLYLSKIQKIQEFSIFLSEYFSEELSDSNMLCLFTNTVPHFFALNLNNLTINSKDIDNLLSYNIQIDKPNNLTEKTSFISFKLQDFIQDSPMKLLNGLELCKSIINKQKDYIIKLQNLRI